MQMDSLAKERIVHENNKSLTTNKALHHIPQLDSLRTFAVFLTLIAHFLPFVIPYTWYGVEIFFTISGFLITTILINTLNNNHGTHKGKILKNFMIRRAFRLFPLYYLFITIFWVGLNYFHLYLWKNEFNPYFFTYLPNIKLYQIGLDNGACFSHLWSLGVEEQFYLVWPFLILFIPARFRIPVIVSLITLSLVLITVNYDDGWFHLLPYANYHTLGVGALLSCFYLSHNKIIDWLKTNRMPFFYISLAQLIVVLILFREHSPFWALYRQLSLCICTFSFVLVSIFGWKGWVGKITRNSFIQYIGTISYGIYILHMPVSWIYKLILSHIAPSLHPPVILSTILYFIISFLLAVFSYKYIETPFLKLKKYFN